MRPRPPRPEAAHGLGLGVPAALFGLAAALAACGEPAKGIDAPACGACHDLAALIAPRSSAPLRAWAGARGDGLVRRPVLMPTAKRAFAAPYPRRGHHRSADLHTCAACHPVSAEGVRHGLRQYPKEARRLAFRGGKDCADGCHRWLPDTVSALGFAPAAGTPPMVTGSLQPHALLRAGTDAHGRIYREGYQRPPGVPLKIQRLKPGCAGCHNVRNERHGTVTECTECHRFDGVTGILHEVHLDAIDARRDALDPGHADLPACRYCHGFGEAVTDLHQAACYNCHLSGHQPLGPEGSAHFWPASP